MESTGYIENLYVEAVDSVVSLLKEYNDELNVSKIYDCDEYIPVTPSIAVMLTDTEEERRTSEGQLSTNLGKARYTIYIYLELWYYHEAFSRSSNMREIYKKLWEISDVVRRNPSIGGFANKLGSEITGSKVISRLRGDNSGGSSILAGGVITLLIKKPIEKSNQS